MRANAPTVCITEHLFRFEEAYQLLHGWWNDDPDPKLASMAERLAAEAIRLEPNNANLHLQFATPWGTTARGSDAETVKTSPLLQIKKKPVFLRQDQPVMLLRVSRFDQA